MVAVTVIIAMNTERQRAIELLNEMQIAIQVIEKQISSGSAKNLYDGEREQLRQIKIKKLCVESQIASSLPIELVGYLGEDVGDEIDYDEHGSIREFYHYLGCPIFPNEHNRHYGTIGYDKFRDITEILQHNIGRFLKITIEAIPLGETENCMKCTNRFKCLTTKVRS